MGLAIGGTPNRVLETAKAGDKIDRPCDTRSWAGEMLLIGLREAKDGNAILFVTIYA